MAFRDWSTTASDNDDADATINYLEGQSPASLNNSARAAMAALASWRDLIDYGTVSGGTVGGSANAITLTNSPTVLAREAGRRYLFKYTSTGTTGAVTLVVDSLTSGAIQYLGAALVSGDIAQNDWVLVVDDGTNFQLLSLARISFFKRLGGLAADATPDAASDYGISLDATDGLPKKFLLNALGATQVQQAAGASNDVYVTAGRQHYHPSACKCHGVADFAGALQGTGIAFNIASVADTGVGRVTFTIATDFSDANWTPVLGIEIDTGTAATFDRKVDWTSKAAGSIELRCYDPSGGALADGVSLSLAGFGVSV